MKKPRTRSSGKVKAGVKCPACGDEVFSLYRHDFRRCRCGSVFVDGGDDYMRFGAQPPVELEDVQYTYRPQHAAEKSMSRAVRDRLEVTPPPLSYNMQRKKYRVRFFWHPKCWGLGRYGPYPKTGKYKGSIFSAQFMLGPVEICRWAQD